MRSFLSKDTILELLSSSVLSDEQITREFNHVAQLINYDNSNISQMADKIDFIATQAKNITDTDHLCQDFSADINDIKKSIDNINRCIGGLTTNSTNNDPVQDDKLLDLDSKSNVPNSNFKLPDTLTTPATSISDLNGITTPFQLFPSARADVVEFLINTPSVPYVKYSLCKDFVDTDSIYFNKLNEETDFNFKLNGRDLGYYGEYDYHYTGMKHDARPISDNCVLSEISNQVHKLFPNFEYNSILVTRYSKSFIQCPPHSDDEADIADDSLIMTLSFGAVRSMRVRRKMEFGNDEFELTPGDIVLMSKGSQSEYDHAIPPAGHAIGARISLTFRLIKPTVRPVYNKNIQKTLLPETQRKKILVLSDSKNLSFDSSEFRNPNTVCFKEPCYRVADIKNFESKFAVADVVLLSTGINDILRGESARNVFQDLRDLIETYRHKYPNTMFLFYAVSDVTGPKYYRYNHIVNEFNDYCFYMSLREKNFKLFSNIFFNDYTHLARDGLHLSMLGKRSASQIWIQAIMCVLGFRKAALPLRPRYVEYRQKRLAATSPVWTG